MEYTLQGWHSSVRQVKRRSLSHDLCACTYTAAMGSSGQTCWRRNRPWQESEQQHLVSGITVYRPQGSDGEQRADVLAAELAAEARRRAGAEAVVEELSQYNTAVIEQAQASILRDHEPKTFPHTHACRHAVCLCSHRSTAAGRPSWRARGNKVLSDG